MKGLTDAERALTFEILDDDVKDAKRNDKSHCVIANALRANPGIQKVEVGARFTRIWNGRNIMRYQTPANLRAALEHFDATGKWDLPSGIYAMRAPTPGRTLKWDREYELKRTKAQKLNKQKHRPERKGIHTLRKVNSRVIEFAKIRQKQFDNLDQLAGEGL